MLQWMIQAHLLKECGLPAKPIHWPVAILALSNHQLPCWVVPMFHYLYMLTVVCKLNIDDAINSAGARTMKRAPAASAASREALAEVTAAAVTIVTATTAPAFTSELARHRFQSLTSQKAHQSSTALAAGVRSVIKSSVQRKHHSARALLCCGSSCGTLTRPSGTLQSRNRIKPKLRTQYSATLYEPGCEQY